MTEPEQRGAVYHLPEQEKPCEECAHMVIDWSHWAERHCHHQPWPERLSAKGTHVSKYGTCGYWEKRP